MTLDGLENIFGIAGFSAQDWLRRNLIIITTTFPCGLRYSSQGSASIFSKETKMSASPILMMDEWTFFLPNRTWVLRYRRRLHKTIDTIKRTGKGTRLLAVLLPKKVPDSIRLNHVGFMPNERYWSRKESSLPKNCPRESALCSSCPYCLGSLIPIMWLDYALVHLQLDFGSATIRLAACYRTTSAYLSAPSRFLCYSVDVIIGFQSFSVIKPKDWSHIFISNGR